MIRCRWLWLCAVSALSPVLEASEEKDVRAADAAAKEVSEPGVLALFAWGDCDGDGRLELATVSAAGELRLLASVGDGRYEDVSARAGLSGVGDAALALWADYDQDGRLDLFVGAQSGASRLFHNEGGSFVDVSEASGFACTGAVRSAQWFDADGDSRLDLFVITAGESALFRGLEGGFFERAELPFEGALKAPAQGAIPLQPPELGELLPPPASHSERGNQRDGRLIDGEVPLGSGKGSGSVATGPAPSSGGASPLLVLPSCVNAIRDQAVPANCLNASTTPTLGRLYPLSANLFVAVGGNVGVGTTSPTARLHVAGTARMTDTLTLAPSGDQALDVSTGSIYKGGALFIHTKGGPGNTALGGLALASATTGYDNTATGFGALSAGTTGWGNTAVGSRALTGNTTGIFNTASGFRALYSNTTGVQNTASGTHALFLNTTGDHNTASGSNALFFNTTGEANTANGFNALFFNTTGYRNSASGARALYGNTSGGNNTASGFEALASNTTGISNTATGSKALFSNTTGYRNSASGARALYGNTSGGDNTASGFEALASNTTGISNTATGSKALFSNTTGPRNTASGTRALYYNSTGDGNTASGYRALYFNTTGYSNTASGEGALSFNTTGGLNTAIGQVALRATTTGYRNTASGAGALFSNTTGSLNTASGYGALIANTTGLRNIGLGYRAGQALTTGNDNIAIGNNGVAAESATIRIGTAGTHTRAFIAGIRGVTTANADAIPVLIDSAGQLGTVSSSRRFKEEIRDMGDATEKLLALRPVTFRYKPEVQSGERPLEYGLIAEEVAEVFPDLVVYDEEGKPFTVKYHLLSAMLLNELQKQAHELSRLRALEERIAALEAGPEGARTRAADDGG
jgi:hypothetical protein